MYPGMFKLKTHCHICGTTGSGKSKFIEACARAHVMARTGFTVLDWHGTLYDAMLEYLAYLGPYGPDRPIYLLNPSEPTHILPYHPFALPDGWDVSAHVSRMTDLVVKPWGAENTNLLPTYERIMKMVFHFMAVTQQPLHHAAKILDYPLNPHLLANVIDSIEDDRVKKQWHQFRHLKSYTAWNKEVGSTQNRLERFIGSRVIRLFTGLGSQFSIERAIEERAIVLVNLKPSKDLSPESAKVFASLLLDGYLKAAMGRGKNPRAHFMYLDECQNYLTSDAADLLDQVVKFGLRLTLSHHHLNQAIFKIHPAIADSLAINAQIKGVFYGIPYEECVRMAQEFFLPYINKRRKKDDTYRTQTDYLEEDVATMSESQGELPAGPTHSRSETHSTRLIPMQTLVKDGQIDWSREEKVSMVAEWFQQLGTGECFLRAAGRTEKYKVPFIERFLRSPEEILQFKETLTRNHIPIHEAEARLKEAERTFLERGNEYAGSGRPKKRPPRLFAQEG
jgi:hypothetical protein